MRAGMNAVLFCGTMLSVVIGLAAESVGPAAAKEPPDVRATTKSSNRASIMATKDWADGECTGVTRLSGLEGQPEIKLSEMFGAPARKETFLLRERQDEFHVTLQNHYPLSVAANAAVQLQEWTWEKNGCRLTIWLHKPAGSWVTLENIRYPGDAEF